MKKIFTLLVAFLTIASGAVWGQETYKITFEDKAPQGFITDSFEKWAGDTWNLDDAFIISINGTDVKLKEGDLKEGFSVEAGSQVSLRLNEKSGINPTIYAGYDIVSFCIQDGTKLIQVMDRTFTMPEKDVLIKDVIFLIKTFPIQIRYYSDNASDYKLLESIEGLDVYYENMNGERITEAPYREKIRLMLKPHIGYKIESIAKVSRTLRNYEWGDKFMSASPQDIVAKKLLQYNSEEGYYFEEFLMPQAKLDTRIFLANTNDGETPDNPITKVVPIDYNLKAETDGNGTITFGEDGKQTTANYQKQVQVNVEPKEGYHLVRTSFTYTAEGSDTPITITRTNGIYTFTMPAADVTVHAEFEAGPEQRYLVSIADIEHGTVSATPIEAVSGTTINLNVEPDNGYKMEALYFLDESGAKFPIDFESKSFLMPSSDVTVYATFVKEENDEGGISTKRYQLFLADRDFYLNDKYDAEGLVLFSRHDKRYAEVGGSFTVYYEKDGEVNVGDYRIFWSKSANGEYKEVKLDEVSGYYQIRNVQSDVYVKIYGRDGFPVSNETIEVTEARAYAQANKIIVVTHEPMDVQIVSMAGAVVGNAKVAGQQEFGNLAEGVYIVRLGDAVVKLQVRN